MSAEIEVKFLNINKGELEQKLVAIGATKEFEKLYKSTSFDYPGFPLDKKAAWVRVRDEGGTVTMAYKQRIGWEKEGNDDGMEEVEVVVSDYETTREFLFKIGLVVKFEQEKKRTRWHKDGVEFDIDEWPRLNPYLEIESSSWEKVGDAIKMLGLNSDDQKICSATQVYELNGINDKDYIKMTFDEFVKRG